MIDLLDTTICILFKADTRERIGNLKCTYAFLTANFNVNINIAEVGKEPEIQNLMFGKNCKYNFYYDDAKELNLTKYKNIQTEQCSTKYMALWDSDVIIEPEQVCLCIQRLRNGLVKVASPFNGKLIELNPILRKTFLKTKDIELIKNIVRDAEPMYGNLSVGAAILFDLQFYKKIGLDNENFKTWGHEDCERVKRAEILGFDLYRSEGVAFHLYHPRLKKEPLQQNHDRNASLLEFLKVSSYLPGKLQSYIGRGYRTTNEENIIF
ncbi:MAG: hypothetical protein JWR50_2063 [Mucilaginibacter sp.]|nr:hypothetical protein [Mucilaginibacter sp.]